jgi:hypothetical protein
MEAADCAEIGKICEEQGDSASLGEERNADLEQRIDQLQNGTTGSHLTKQNRAR